jgi:hypothetical protein
MHKSPYEIYILVLLLLSKLNIIHHGDAPFELNEISTFSRIDTVRCPSGSDRIRWCHLAGGGLINN